MEKLHFRSHNLVATIAPEEAACFLASLCPSRTCCAPPSGAFDCFFSMLMPRAAQLDPDDLRTILRDMRSKLQVEKRGLDLVLTTNDDRVAAGWRQVLEGEGLPNVEDVAKSS